MSDQAIKHAIQRIGKVEVETGGNLIKFELISTLDQKIQCQARYEMMQSILFALRAGMELATEEMTKRPGFRVQDHAPRLRVKRYTCGLLTGAASETLVCLNVETKLDFSLSFMVPPDEAESMAVALLRMATQARHTQAPKPS